MGEQVDKLVRLIANATENSTLANAATLVSEVAVRGGDLEGLAGAGPPLVAALRREGVGAEFNVMQKNCAVALAKLAKHPKNLMQIRKLHGIELMYRIVAAGR